MSERNPIDLKELVIRKTLTRFLLIISVWTGLNPGKEEEREARRLEVWLDGELDDLEDDNDAVDDDKDP